MSEDEEVVTEQCYWLPFQKKLYKVPNEMIKYVGKPVVVPDGETMGELTASTGIPKWEALVRLGNFYFLEATAGNKLIQGAYVVFQSSADGDSDDKYLLRSVPRPVIKYFCQQLRGATESRRQRYVHLTRDFDSSMYVNFNPIATNLTPATASELAALNIVFKSKIKPLSVGKRARDDDDEDVTEPTAAPPTMTVLHADSVVIPRDLFVAMAASYAF